MIKIEHLSKIYKSKKGINTLALDDISLTLENKGMIFIVGKSGSGKSTFLNIIGGLDRFDKGNIIVNNGSFSLFKNKDYDSYRNANIGFIFQDFNLIDEYNVYQNIELSLSLQKKKITKDKMDELLSMLGLTNLGNRKTNELSGGQKQRVSLARALIKNPDIILADEPTGALDGETGKQIFDLLKIISKNKLVIIVSHDMESAKNYADRIIQFSDGKIVYDSGIKHQEEKEIHFKKTKTKFPFLSAFKLSFANLKTKRIKLVFTIILIMFALSFFGMSRLMSNYNLSYSHAVTMHEEKEDLVSINKNILQDDGTYQALSGLYAPFDESDIKNIEFMLKTNTIKVNNIYEDGNSINFEIPYKNSSKTPAYYSYVLSNLQFIELNNAKEFDLKLIGKYPETLEEIAIHKYLADYIIYNGITLYSENENTKDKISYKEPEVFKPASYSELISSDKYIKLGTSKVKIVGVIDDDLSKYDSLKNIPYSEININNEKLINNFSSTYNNIINKIYVKNGFIEGLKIKENLSLDQNDFLFSYQVSEDSIPINSKISVLANYVEIFDGTRKIKKNNLNSDEIIINKEYLNTISNNKFDELLNSYITTELKNSENQLTDDELEKKFIDNYLIENKIINSKVKLKITDYNKKINQDVSKMIENVNIVGYSDEDIVFISSNILSDYLHKKCETYKLYFKENNIQTLELIFKNIPISNSKFTTETKYSSNIINIADTLNIISQVAFYFSIIFFVFSLILLVNFIGSTISSSKKQIGILRALGARKKDIVKIFLIESLLISIISLIFSLVICFACCSIGNDLFVKELLFTIRPIIFSVDIIKELSLVVIIIVLISTIIPAYKISSMRPVDAIYNK